MFINNINPILLSIGPFSIRYYGLIYVIGFLIGYWWLSRAVKQGLIKNMTEELLETYLLFLIIGVVVGARVFEFIFYEPGRLFSDPLSFFRVWEGGLSFHGGLFGVFMVTWWFSHKYKIKLLQMADVLVVPAAFALFLGRIANFINSELVGTITNVKWCVNFHGETNNAGELVCRHPSQLYESLKNLFMFFVLFNLKDKKFKDGFLFWLFFTMYGFLRFFVNFWRDDPKILLGIGMGQILSLIMGIVGLIIIFRYYHPIENKSKKSGQKRRKRKNTKKKKKEIGQKDDQ